jgi:hypothetical protein
VPLYTNEGIGKIIASFWNSSRESERIMKSKIILVVDDDPNISRIIKHNLEKDGHTVLTADRYTIA